MLTAEEKVEIYERYLHQIQLNAVITMNNEHVRQLISNACAWSYSHRSGNGEIPEDEQQANIEHYTKNLCMLY